MHSHELEILVDKISCLASKFADMKSESDLSIFREMVSEALTGTTVSYSDFQGFIDQLCRASDTVCFWYRFLCVDCFSYIALFLSLCYRFLYKRSEDTNVSWTRSNQVLSHSLTNKDKKRETNISSILTFNCDNRAFWHDFRTFTQLTTNTRLYCPNSYYVTKEPNGEYFAL